MQPYPYKVYITSVHNSVYNFENPCFAGGFLLTFTIIDILCHPMQKIVLMLKPRHLAEKILKIIGDIVNILQVRGFSGAFVVKLFDMTLRQ